MKPDPLLTICVPAYNSQKTVGRTLESILEQTYLNFEVLVSDNNSTDDTIKIAESFKDQKVTIRKNIQTIVSNKYMGCYDNYNGCIKSGLIRGEFVAFYHSDDIYNKEIAEREVAFLMDHPEVGAVFTMANKIDQNDNIIGKRQLPKDLTMLKKNIYQFPEIFKSILCNGNIFLITPTFMTRTKIFNEIGLFSEEQFGTSSDLEMWLRILKKHPIGILKNPLINHRISGGGKSYSKARSKRADFFKVIDYYLQKDSLPEIEKKTLRQYELQKYLDDILLAINFFVRNQITEAIMLLKKPLTFAIIQALFENISITRIKIVVLKIVLLVGIFLGLTKPLSKLLKKI